MSRASHPPPRTTTLAALRQTLGEVVPELAAAQGLGAWRRVAAGPAIATQDDLCGFVALSGGLQGWVMFEIPRSLLSRSYATVRGLSGPFSLEELADWCGELTNQAVGRLQNRTAPTGTRFSQASPAVVLGNQGQVLSAQRGAAEALCFGRDGERVRLWLQAELPASGGRGPPAGCEAVEAHPEGSCLVF